MQDAGDAELCAVLPAGSGGDLPTSLPHAHLLWNRESLENRYLSMLQPLWGDLLVRVSKIRHKNGLAFCSARAS